MHADAEVIAAVSTPPAKRKRRRRAPVVARIDKRTRTARRIAEIEAAIVRGLGGDAVVQAQPMLAANIKRAAELTALAEAARGKALRSGGALFDPAAVVKLEGAADRAVRRLGIRPQGGAEHVPLRERLAREAAEAV